MNLVVVSRFSNSRTIRVRRGFQWRVFSVCRIQECSRPKAASVCGKCLATQSFQPEQSALPHQIGLGTGHELNSAQGYTRTPENPKREWTNKSLPHRTFSVDSDKVLVGWDIQQHRTFVNNLQRIHDTQQHLITVNIMIFHLTCRGFVEKLFGTRNLGLFYRFKL